MSHQRILVTGGAGFIGSHTVDLLLQENFEVLVLDNLSTGKMENLDLTHPRLKFVNADILDYPLLAEKVAECDAVLHLAAIVSVPKSIENPILTFLVNTLGCLHVFQAVREASRPIRVVYASSASVYGDAKQLPCRDDLSLSDPPLSPYASQKLHAEEYADLYARYYDVKSVGLRYFNVYGLRQDPQSPYSGVISRFKEAYQKDETLTIHGDGLQTRDFIHVSDVAKANVLALQSDYVGTLNIATGEPKTLLEMISYLESNGDKSAKYTFGSPRAGDIKDSFAATELAATHIGFKHTLSLQEGIKLFMSEPCYA